MDKERRIMLFDLAMKDIVSNEFREWLLNNGYFEAPASSKYHLTYPGGLFDHSWNVVRALKQLTKNENLTWQREASPYIIGFFHDLCKIDMYILNSETNTYIYNPRQAMVGHGDKSVILTSQFLTLTDEEIDCIRYHMGAFTDKEEWSKYTEAIQRHNNVLWTHQADMVASQILEIGKK